MEMFKERIIVTLKQAGLILGFIVVAFLCLVLLYMLCSFPPNSIVARTLNQIGLILVYVLVTIIGLMILFLIITYVVQYLNWQFIEPYREWKNRGKRNDG
jgi:hypothetical protein